MVHPAFYFSLPDKEAFVVMKEPGTYLTKHLAGSPWHPQGSRAPNRQGPEGFEGSHRQDFRDNGGIFQLASSQPACYHLLSMISPYFKICRLRMHQNLYSFLF